MPAGELADSFGAALYAPYLVARYYGWLETGVVVCALFIFVSSVDDLFVDACYWTRWIARRLSGRPETVPEVAELRAKPEQPLAVMVPAWLEYDVIAPMIESMAATLDYSRYTVFAGVYVNDERTIAEVERIRRRFRHVVRVTVPHPGPTCKSDCLNFIVAAIAAHERAYGVVFAGAILHDSEDVLHPLEMKLFNHVLPAEDLIQIPVMSLEREWWELIGATYMDDFAEWHGKDMLVREALTGTVLSAGVGTCFSRRALMALSEETGGQPFNVAVLTEDYDVSLRLGARGMSSTFLRFPVDYRVKRRGWINPSREKTVTLTAPLAVREFFPDTFRTAYRQKARWTLGIAFQGWRQLGWRGSLADRYFLYRDRKGVAAFLVIGAAYLLTAQILVLFFAAEAGLWPERFPSIFVTHPWFGAILAADGAFLGLRAIQRYHFTRKLYGRRHGLLSIPRIFIANFVNFAATLRAWRLFLANVLFGTPIGWDKTMHDFPTTDSLGETEPPHHGLDEETIAEAVAAALGLPRAELTSEEVGAALDLAPPRDWRRWGVAPFRRPGDDAPRLATALPPVAGTLDEIRAALGSERPLHVVRESELLAALRRLEGDAGAFADIGFAHDIHAGDVLISHGLVARAALDEAFAAYDPARDGPVGAFLFARGLPGRDALERARDLLRETRATGDAS
ncbi:glycosyl transferase family protein [Methylocella sp.]|uniref:glycosyl transferase family protein n=1 Tax=Methylocella sp. TaxID=1978226 RepID=UPI003784CB0C